MGGYIFNTLNENSQYLDGLENKLDEIEMKYNIIRSEKNKNDINKKIEIEKLKKDLKESLKNVNKINMTESAGEKTQNLIIKCKILFAKIHKDQNMLQDSLVELESVLNYIIDEKEKKKIKNKIKKLKEKIYDFSSNKIFIKNTTNCKSIKKLLKNGACMDKISSFYDIQNLDDIPYYINFITKNNIINELEILNTLKQMMYENFKDKVLKYNIDSSCGIQAISHMISSENDYLLKNLLNDVLKLIIDNPLIFEHHIYFIKIILENPHVKTIELHDLENILKILNKQLNQIKIQDYPDEKNTDYITNKVFLYVKSVSKILDLISNITTDNIRMHINAELHKELKKILKSLQSKMKNISVINFQLKYALQSLIRVNDGVPFIGNLFNRFNLMFKVASNLQDVILKKNPIKLLDYSNYSIYKECVEFEKKEVWFEQCRKLEIFFNYGHLDYLEAEVRNRLKEAKINSNYFFYIILEFINEYDRIIKFFSIRNLINKNIKEIEEYHNQIIDFLYFLLIEILENPNFKDETKKIHIVYLLINFFFKSKAHLSSFLEIKSNNNYNSSYSNDLFEKELDDEKINCVINESDNMINYFEIIENSLNFLSEKIDKILIIKNNILKNPISSIKDSLNISKKIKNICSNETEYIKQFFTNKDAHWKLKLYYHHYKRVKCIEENDFLIEKNKLFIPRRGSFNRHDNDKNQFDILNHIKTKFLKSTKKVLILIGVSGVGKSTFTQFLENHLIKNRFNDYIPFYINLTSIADPINKIIKNFFAYIKLYNEIQELYNSKILFILDGFDEINNLNNIYNNNDFKSFRNSKLIISCREEYFDLININKNYMQIFSPNNRDDLVDICYLREFTNENKQDFIKKYLNLYQSSNDFKNWDVNKITNKLKEFDPKEEFSTVPFYLHLLCKSIPFLSKTGNLRKFQLYECFLKEWFKKEYIRIKNLKWPKNKEQEIFSNQSDEKSIKELMDFSENLAVTFFEHSYLTYSYEKVNSINNETSLFQKFFIKDTKTEIFRKSVPLIY